MKNKKIVHKLSSNKKREVLARKLSVLEVIEEKKGVLFAQFSSSVTQADKVRGWEAVLQRAKAVGLVAQNRDWRFIRDKVFSVWKSRTTNKRENAIVAGSARDSIKFNKVDLKILDIIGQDSPALDKIIENEVPGTESQNQDPTKQDVPHVADVQNISWNTETTTNDQNEVISKRKSKIDTKDYLSQKKKLTLELLNHDIYLRKLKALKLEKELGLKRSEYTQALKVKEIKTESTCEMEFEY